MGYVYPSLIEQENIWCEVGFSEFKPCGCLHFSDIFLFWTVRRALPQVCSSRVKCFLLISVHSGLEKGRREERNSKKDQHTCASHSTHLFKEAEEKMAGDYGVGQVDLVCMSREHDLSLLQQFGGVVALSEKLETNIEKGILGDDEDL
ncbi:hypothetical protein Nepgr_015443 [Nepenthes gracilis]|uniref:Uncharacterized protein n=1 Tax=Nepenthes gracilis TaxID=150966 RepID=A0AAD3XQE1_NEPGR|nr:hypothetical protein Nepgr_015443 [Nepenthes gracilis]